MFIFARFPALTACFLSLCACASSHSSKPAPTTEADKPIFVPAYRFSSLSCFQLASERRDVALKLEHALADQKQAPGRHELFDSVFLGVPMGSMTDDSQKSVPQLKGELIAIDEAAKTCRN